MGKRILKIKETLQKVRNLWNHRCQEGELYKYTTKEGKGHSDFFKWFLIK